MSLLMRPARWVAILLAGVLILTATLECCLPSGLQPQSSANCSHPGEHRAPPPVVCAGMKQMVAGRALAGTTLQSAAVSLTATLEDVNVSGAKIGKPEDHSGPPVSSAFRRHTPLLI